MKRKKLNFYLLYGFLVKRIFSEVLDIMFMQYVISRSTEGNKDDSSMGKLNEIPEAEKLEEEKPKNSSDSVEISRIEQLMQGKSFSR